jgi:glycerol-3-phosphate acyltransferase PlsY
MPINHEWLIFWMVLGYLMGTIPFGLLLTRAAGMGDIRTIGSGNIGSTNVLRTGNKPLALATLVLDGGKGALAVGLAMWFSHDAAAPLLAGGAAFLGHIFPVWLRFKGGKGVATFLGTLLALSLPVGAATLATWILVAILFRYSSLSALAAATLAPVYAFAMKGMTVLMAVALIMAMIIYMRHVDNIRRLASGRESRIGRKKG